MPSSTLSKRSSIASSSISTPELCVNSIVNDDWIVQRFLNASTLLVRHRTNERLYAAMTVEPWNQDQEAEMLRYEIYVLRLMQNSSHVARIFVSGSIPGYNFMVTSLRGQNLEQLRESMPSKRFTTGTSLRIALQVINALADLHTAGFVHRDVKPSNFCFGSSGSTRRTLLFTDFSLVRQILVDPQSRNLELRRPRERVIFRGCPRYCSVNVHRLREPSTHDDLISVLFMTAEMITGKLLWDSRKRKDIAAVKNESSLEKIFESCPNEIVDLYRYLSTTTYYEQPNYHQIVNSIKKALSDRRIDLDDPYDWEEGGRYFYYKMKEKREQRKEQKQLRDSSSMVTAHSEALTTTATEDLYIPEVSDINTLDMNREFYGITA